MSPPLPWRYGGRTPVCGDPLPEGIHRLSNERRAYTVWNVVTGEPHACEYVDGCELVASGGWTWEPPPAAA